MRRMLARLGRVLLIVAVLLAQQTALAHDLWHAAGSPTTQGAKSPGPKANKLCDLHDLLGTVLGVASGSAPAPACLAPSQPGFIPAAAVIREAALLAPHSRDPPLIS
jgi:hypothetical protein